MYLFSLLLFILSFVEGRDGYFVLSGFNFSNGEWSGPKYNTTDATNEIGDMNAQTSNNCVQLTFAWYQNTINDTLIYKNSTLTPSDDRLIYISNFIKKYILCVVLRPTIIIVNNNNGQYSHRDIGKYFTTKTQWDLWFSNYTSFINHYASISKQVNADQYVIGRELMYTTSKNDYWIDLINNIKITYNGNLRYDAINGNENNILFWSNLDFIGIDAYYSLVTTTLQPTISQLNDAWKPIVNSLNLLYTKYNNKMIVFGEIGYCSCYGTNINPDQCLQSNQPLNITAQENCYSAFLNSIYSQPFTYGVFLWNWKTDSNDKGNQNKGYTVNGKNTNLIKKLFRMIQCINICVVVRVSCF